MANKANKLSKLCRQNAAWRDKAKDYRSFLTIQEFCKKYFVSKWTVRRMIQARQIRAFLLKGRWYVKAYSEGYSEPIRRH